MPMFAKYNLYTTVTGSLRYGLVLETSATKYKVSSPEICGSLGSLGCSVLAVIIFIGAVL
jgi:hypothetical protein